MELRLVRAKTGIHVPVDPEDSKSRTVLVQRGLVTLVPTDFKLPEETYELIQKVSTVKKKK